MESAESRALKLAWIAGVTAVLFFFFVALQSVLGNTVVRGIILGLVPTLILIPLLHGRIERFFGFAPVGETPGHRGEREASRERGHARPEELP